VTADDHQKSGNLRRLGGRPTYDPPRNARPNFRNASPTAYVVRTRNGYVGAVELGCLTDDQPRPFAYTYGDRETAEEVAVAFAAVVETLS